MQAKNEQMVVKTELKVAHNTYPELSTIQKRIGYSAFVFPNSFAKPNGNPCSRSADKACWLMILAMEKVAGVDSIGVAIATGAVPLALPAVEGLLLSLLKSMSTSIVREKEN